MARILHLSDIHFGAENPAALAAVTTLIHHARFDLLLVTGDITQFGSRDEFTAAKLWFDSLPGPKLLTPGNHDTPYVGVWDRAVAPFARYANHFGVTDQGDSSGADWTVHTMNTARGAQLRLNWSKGAVGHRQAETAAAHLQTAPPGALRVIACHHPLVEVLGGPMTGAVRGGRRAAQILAEGGADLILSGHVHTPFAFPLPFGDRMTYAVGAGTLSIRERGAPAGFNLVESDPTCVRIQAMAWTGSHFHPARTWSLDRRVRPLAGPEPGA